MPSVDSDDIELYLPDTGERVRFWTGYTANSEFMTPSDKWSFATGNAGVIGELRNTLQPGTRVTGLCNDHPQFSGYVDSVVVTSGDDGAKMTVTGRDTLSPVVDAGIDPRLVFTESTTLLDLVASVVAPYGFRVISTAPIANRAVITGISKPNVVRTGTTFHLPQGTLEVFGSIAKVVDTLTSVTVYSEYDPTKPKFLKDVQLKQLSPKPSEGAWEFLARCLKRFQLWAWPSALGDTLVVGQPDFTQASQYSLRRKFAGRSNNVLTSSLTVDLCDQPSVIIASGKGGNQSFDKVRLHVAAVNEFTACNSDGVINADVQSLIRAYKGISVLDVRKEMLPFTSDMSPKFARPVYLSDEDSNTTDQLESVVRAEMSKRQAHAFVYEATVRGHTQNGKPWAVDTMIDVDDDVADVHEPLYVKERTFTKSDSGTTTKLVLCRPHTLDLS